MDTKQLILGTVGNLVKDFLNYDRRYDEELPRGIIEQAIKDGTVTIGEIMEAFEKELMESI